MPLYLRARFLRVALHPINLANNPFSIVSFVSCVAEAHIIGEDVVVVQLLDLISA